MMKFVIIIFFLNSLISHIISISPSIATKHDSHNITITIIPTSTIFTPSLYSVETLELFASTSLIRARHLKRRELTNTSLSTLKLFTQTYGAHYFHLSFATPPQTLPFLFDTGSSFVWFPCGSNYKCFNCSFPSIDKKLIPTFNRSMSSSSKELACNNPKCSWVFGQNAQSQLCPKCKSNNSQICSQDCPPYECKYGIGSTNGVLLLETLHFPNKTVRDFVVGCSSSSTNVPFGIAGFGRGLESLPSQLGIKKFSYCLSYNRFNNHTQNIGLILNGDSNTNQNLSFVPFHRNPSAQNQWFRNYYYVNLQYIIVGDQLIKIPKKFQVPGYDGHGGTIIDSGSSFTFMERHILNAVTREFEKELGKNINVGNKGSIVGPCFNISSKTTPDLPQLIFLFQGGARMKLPPWNYFSVGNEIGTVCLSIVTDKFIDLPYGPTIILGNHQQQDFFMEYDLENERLGFRAQFCD